MDGVEWRFISWYYYNVVTSMHEGLKGCASLEACPWKSFTVMGIAVSLLLTGGRLSEHLLVSNHGHLTVWMPVQRRVEATAVYLSGA